MTASDYAETIAAKAVDRFAIQLTTGPINPHVARDLSSRVYQAVLEAFGCICYQDPNAPYTDEGRRLYADSNCPVHGGGR